MRVTNVTLDKFSSFLAHLSAVSILNYAFLNYNDMAKSNLFIFNCTKITTPFSTSDGICTDFNNLSTYFSGGIVLFFQQRL